MKRCEKRMKRRGKRCFAALLAAMTALMGFSVSYGTELPEEGRQSFLTRFEMEERSVLEDGGESQASPSAAPVDPLFVSHFLEDCEGQQWFIDEVERLMNFGQRTVSSMTQADLNRITSLGMSGKGIEGKLPEAVKYLANLKYLFLADNQLAGDLPEGLWTLQNLEIIDLSGNQYEGQIPARFRELPKLQVLRLSGNRYTGAIPLELTEIGALRLLDLSDNYLTGGIPEKLADLGNLQYLELSWNQLGGEIPGRITQMDQLLVFAAWDCGLTGEVPANIGDMVSLEMLDLAENSLTGEIPASIVNLEQIREIALTGNLLTGTVPEAFSSDMDQLLAVHLDDNKLRGFLPESLYERFDSIQTEVTFSQNYMTGEKALLIEENGDLGTEATYGNFLDDSQGQQYRLTGPSHLSLKVGQRVNVFESLRNIIASGTTTLPKPMRPFEEYVVDWEVPPEIDEITTVELVTGTQRDGVYLTFDEEVPLTSAAAFAIQIKDNDGSEYSTWRMKASTYTPPPGGSDPGSSGGSPSPEEPVPVYDHHRPYISGYEDKTVQPDRSIAREEAAVMLFRLLSEQDQPNEVSYTGFPDVETSRWSAGYINFARKQRLLSGYPGASGGGSTSATFRPEGQMSRKEFATMLCNLMELVPLSQKPEGFHLTDVEADWAEGYIYAAYQSGYIAGYQDDTFRGERPVTRAEAVTMLNSAMKRTEALTLWKETRGNQADGKDTDGNETKKRVNPFIDLSENHWAYQAILEAAIDHDYLVVDVEELEVEQDV